MSASPPAPPTVASLGVDRHRTFGDARGLLVPVETARLVPFAIARVFWVFDVPAGGERGGHAHRLCSQYLLCLKGALEVLADDGTNRRTLTLETGCGLLLPPTIWAAERYITADAALLVLCDRPYEVEDYIDRIEDVRAFRAGRP